MRYEDFLEPARRSEFFKDERTVEAVTKAVLGVLVSRLDAVPARRLTSVLPKPLTYEVLRWPQPKVADISADAYIESIAAQFHLRKEHALRVVTSILWAVKEGVPGEIFSTVLKNLPNDWKELLETGRYTLPEGETG